VTPELVVSALGLPPAARVDQRVPKKLLLENGAPTAADKRQIQEGIEELSWIAALKPETIGIPAYQDEEREYLEIAILSLRLRAEAKPARLVELVHRAIPYPVLLIRAEPQNLALSLARPRWSQGEKGKTVLEGMPLSSSLEGASQLEESFLASLQISSHRHRHLHSLYEGWIESLEAYAASRHTGVFALAPNKEAVSQRRSALAEHDRLKLEIASLRSRAAKEKQLNRRVEINLQIKQLESRLAETARHF
jgi:hypothetical protein